MNQFLFPSTGEILNYIFKSFSLWDFVDTTTLESDRKYLLRLRDEDKISFQHVDRIIHEYEDGSIKSMSVMFGALSEALEDPWLAVMTEFTIYEIVRKYRETIADEGTFLLNKNNNIQWVLSYGMLDRIIMSSNMARCSYPEVFNLNYKDVLLSPNPFRAFLDQLFSRVNKTSYELSMETDGESMRRKIDRWKEGKLPQFKDLQEFMIVLNLDSETSKSFSILGFLSLAASRIYKDVTKFFGETYLSEMLAEAAKLIELQDEIFWTPVMKQYREVRAQYGDFDFVRWHYMVIEIINHSKGHLRHTLQGYDIEAILNYKPETGEYAAYQDVAHCIPEYAYYTLTTPLKNQIQPPHEFLDYLSDVAFDGKSYGRNNLPSFIGTLHLEMSPEVQTELDRLDALSLTSYGKALSYFIDDWRAILYKKLGDIQLAYECSKRAFESGKYSAGKKLVTIVRRYMALAALLNKENDVLEGLAWCSYFGINIFKGQADAIEFHRQGHMDYFRTKSLFYFVKY